MKPKKILFGGILSVIIVFFSYTLVNKIINIESFMLNIAKTGVFHIKIIDFVAYLVLFIETLSIVLLIFKEKLGILLSLSMMIFFTVYIILLQLLGRYEVCGCGGILNGLSFSFHLLINLMVIILLLLCYSYGKNEKKIS